MHRRHVLLYASFTGSGKCVGMSHIWLVLVISWWQCWWGYDLGTQGHKCTILKVWDILGQGWEGSECGFGGRHTWGEQVNIAKVAKEQAAASSKDELLCAGISFPTNICSWESFTIYGTAVHSVWVIIASSSSIASGFCQILFGQIGPAIKDNFLFWMCQLIIREISIILGILKENLKQLH